MTQYTRWGDQKVEYIMPGARVCEFCRKQFYRKSPNETTMLFNVHMTGEMLYGGSSDDG